MIYRHGEVLLVPTTLPTGAKVSKEVKSYIVAHSETGHHHVLESTVPYSIYETEEGTIIKLKEQATLVHEKSGKDMHKSHVIEPNTYKVVQKRQYNYFTRALERVRD